MSPSRPAIAARIAGSASGRWIIAKRPPGASSARDARSRRDRRAALRREPWASARRGRGRRERRPIQEGGLVTTGRPPSASPAARRSPGVENTSQHAARVKPVARSVAPGGRADGRSRQIDMPLRRRASARPTAPTPAPTSTIRPSGVPAAAASSAASLPTGDRLRLDEGEPAASQRSR